jgi:hypothetical protein
MAAPLIPIAIGIAARLAAKKAAQEAVKKAAAKRVVSLSKVRPGSGRPVPNKGGGLKTTTGKPKTKVTAKDAKTASSTMKQRPNEAGRARAVTKPDNTVGLGRAEARQVRIKRPVTKTKVDPAGLRKSLEERAKARAIQRSQNVNTKPPMRPKVLNSTPVKRDINPLRTTFEGGAYKPRAASQDLKSPDRTNPQGTIESRTSQNPSSRGTNVERIANRPTRSQREADRRVEAGLKAISGKNKPTPSMSKNQINEILRKRWKKAGPAQRLIIEKQAKLLKNTPKKK